MPHVLALPGRTTAGLCHAQCRQRNGECRVADSHAVAPCATTSIAYDVDWPASKLQAQRQKRGGIGGYLALSAPDCDSMCIMRHCRTLLFGLCTMVIAGAAGGFADALQDAQEKVNRFGYSQPLPRAEGAIRLATYNMENFFDQADDPSLSGEFDDIKFATDLRRVEKLAEAIRTTDADIIALQEVESLEALRWLRDNFLSDMGYDHIASRDVNYFRGVECSFMSRFPIVEQKVWVDEPLSINREGFGWSDIPASARRDGLTFRRSPFLIRVRVRPDYELTLFSIHHKAGRTSHYQREAEALRVIDFINTMQQRDPSRNILVMGDFNAAPWDKSMRVYREAGMIDPHSHRIIPRWNEDDLRETNLYKTHQSGRVLDYILLNAAAYNEFVPGSAHVYGTLTPPEGWDWRTDPHPDGYASDHYPVIIDLLPRNRN